MRDVLDSLDKVVGHIQRDQIDECVQSFQLLDAIVTDVKLFQVDQSFEAFYLDKPVALDTQQL